jgi:hypothetical protein
MIFDIIFVFLSHVVHVALLTPTAILTNNAGLPANIFLPDLFYTVSSPRVRMHVN